jgi:hypothetical protein
MIFSGTFIPSIWASGGIFPEYGMCGSLLPETRLLRKNFAGYFPLKTDKMGKKREKALTKKMDNVYFLLSTF